MMMMPEDMIGAIKIKDGLFIGDEFSAQVSQLVIYTAIFVYMSFSYKCDSFIASEKTKLVAISLIYSPLRFYVSLTLLCRILSS